MLRKVITLILLAVASAVRYECGRPVKSIRESPAFSRFYNRIVGGWVAEPNSFPWQVRVMVHIGGDDYEACGGTLVQTTSGESTDLVLTAAHCFEREGKYADVKKITVLVGGHNMADPQESTRREIKVKQYFHHDFSRETNENDLALLQLENPVKYSDSIVPVCLPRTHEKVPTDKKCYVTGWGTVSEGGSPSALLRQVDVTVLTTGLCVKETNQDLMFCAGKEAGGKDSCQGDSGGPLVCESGGKYTQYGVVSFGVGCARRDLPGVYVRLPRYITWLTQSADALHATSPTTPINSAHQCFMANKAKEVYHALIYEL
ncbi:serine protease [Trichuris trichiura]|uniref:Serine protease n=1 Tax=Trichuris trichiura TaxID=36087 RepID=A0A077ZFG1_TRITR|nr:serine protease [Trichuris trichiura]